MNCRTRLIAPVLIFCPPLRCHASPLIKISLCSVAALCSFNGVIDGAGRPVLLPLFTFIPPYFFLLSFPAKRFHLPEATSLIILVASHLLRPNPPPQKKCNRFVCTVFAHSYWRVGYPFYTPLWFHRIGFCLLTLTCMWVNVNMTCC